ncbi:MAG: sodium:proton antiporter [Streptomycetaceae bacterium]|nr:sodium:proton antiporter [Streptomycetaceae bacterium]
MGLFAVAACVVGVWFAVACVRLPDFGGVVHPYADRAVAAALRQHTANAVASVNFDQRAFDTLGEETILLAAVLGATMLLRPARDEHKERPAAARVLPTTRLFGTVLLPVTVLTGFYVVAHGQISPGGGFQGGVVLATGLHLAYVAADYRVLQRVRPLAVLDVADAVAAGAYTALGLVGIASGVAFLANTLPLGTFGTVTSGGLVPLVNAAVGIEVASGVIVLVARFLDQAVEVSGGRGRGGSAS